MRVSIPIRTRFFLAGEGRSEQSFVRLLQQFCDTSGMSVYLDCEPLDGGGYQKMLEDAIRYRKSMTLSAAASGVVIPVSMHKSAS